VTLGETRPDDDRALQFANHAAMVAYRVNLRENRTHPHLPGGI
jgi:hypothetical protein